MVYLLKWPHKSVLGVGNAALVSFVAGGEEEGRGGRGRERWRNHLSPFGQRFLLRVQHTALLFKSSTKADGFRHFLRSGAAITFNLIWVRSTQQQIIQLLFVVVLIWADLYHPAPLEYIQSIPMSFSCD